jgi:hypothetical protein
VFNLTTTEMHDASAWASQVLPKCTAITADSVRAIGREATKIVVQQLINIYFIVVTYGILYIYSKHDDTVEI